MFRKRNRALCLTIAFVVLTCFAVVQNVEAAPNFTEPPKIIGVVEPRSGVYAEVGEYGARGAQLAVDQYNARGGVLGSELKLIVEDTQSVPNVGAQKARKLITEKNAVMLVGEVSSAVAAVMANVCQELNTIYMASGPNGNNIRMDDNKRVMFITDCSNWQAGNAMVDYLLKTEGKRWYFITADYTWGRTAYETASKLLKKNGGIEVGNDFSPFGTSDFSSYLLKIKQAKPDVVYLSIGGTDGINFQKQFAQFGMKGTMTVSGAIINDSDAWTLGEGVMDGVWPHVWSYNVNTPGSKAFTAQFREKFGKYPENESWQDYISVVAYLEAVKKAKTWDTEAVIKVLEDPSFKFDGLKERDVYYRLRDHQLQQEVYIVKTREGKWPDPQDWCTIVATYPGKDQSLESIDSTMEENPTILQRKFPLKSDK